MILFAIGKWGWIGWACRKGAAQGISERDVCLVAQNDNGMQTACGLIYGGAR